MTTRIKVFLAHDPGGYDVLFPVVQQYIADRKSIQFYCVGPAAKLNPAYAIDEPGFMEVLENLISKHLLSVLVTGTSWGSDFELRAISVCKASQITTACLLDYWSNYALRMSSNDKLPPIYPDYYIVMDELARKEAVSDGVPPHIIHVLGHPGLDRFVKVNKSNASCNTPNYITRKKKALFLSQPLSHLYGDSLGYTEQIVLEDCEKAFQRNGWELAVKFHPKDHEALKQKYAQLAIQGDLLELLPQYDVIIGMNTMGLLHAVLMGVKAISYQPNLAQPDVCITNKLKLTPALTNFEQLLHEIERIHPHVSNETSNSPDLMESYIWMDGKSAERVYHFLEEVDAQNDH
jgi:hypothetical protein